MASKGFRAGKSYKNQYKRYKENNTFEKNKIRKLTKLVKKQPNNIELAEHLKLLLKNGCNYTRNRKIFNPCKGRLSIFGWVNNKTTSKNYKVIYSYIWHISNNFSKWFLPVQEDKYKTANNAKTIRHQLINLGYSPSNERKR